MSDSRTHHAIPISLGGLNVYAHDGTRILPYQCAPRNIRKLYSFYIENICARAKARAQEKREDDILSE